MLYNILLFHVIYLIILLFIVLFYHLINIIFLTHLLAKLLILQLYCFLFIYIYPLINIFKFLFLYIIINSMCGIFGLFSNNISSYQNLFNNFNSLKSRGPDRSKILYNENYFIGFHRLAIHGLNHNSDQPFIYENNNDVYVVLVNGEIYNYKYLINCYDLKVDNDSDCSIIYPLFKKLNYDFKLLNNYLDGEFSLVIIHLRNDKLQKIYLSSDPLCVRPLFYHHDIINKTFSFSSLLSGLKDFNDIRRLDQNEYIIYDNINNMLFYENINIIKYNNNYQSSLSNDNIFDFNSYIYSDIYYLIYNCIVKRLDSERPIACLLSGGLDSSIICSIVSSYYYINYPDKKLKVFTIGMNNSTDVYYSKILVKHLNSQFNNIEHIIVNFSVVEALSVLYNVINVCETFDITTIRASVGQYLISKYISENTDIKVILNGDGADECQMGYLYFYNHPTLEEAQNEHYNLLKNIHYFDGLRVDRNISHWGLEARVPFLDFQFVKYYLNLPAICKVPTKEYIEKYLIRKSFDVMNNNLLPDEILWRKKEAFSDGVSSVEKSWYQYIQEHINNLISDEEFENCKTNKHINTKEAYYYYKTFNSLFNNNNQIIPYYWLPNWSNNINEPSARVLNVYNNN